MGLIPQVKCRRCGAVFSSMRSRCPNCGTRMVQQSTRVPAPTPSAVKGTQASNRANKNAKWQLAFGLVLVAAVMLAVIVMVSTSLEGIDSTAVARATPIPREDMLATPVIETPSPPPATPMPTIEKVSIQYAPGGQASKDLTDKDFTMHPGEAIRLKAIPYPQDIENAVVEWSWTEGAEDYATFSYTDGDLVITCNETVAGGITIFATCNGTTNKVQAYLVN